MNSLNQNQTEKKFNIIFPGEEKIEEKSLGIAIKENKNLSPEPLSYQETSLDKENILKANPLENLSFAQKNSVLENKWPESSVGALFEDIKSGLSASEIPISSKAQAVEELQKKFSENPHKIVEELKIIKEKIHPSYFEK